MNRIYITLKLALILLLVLCTNISFAWALADTTVSQNYYVSEQIGLDTNDGLSTSSPFKTIQKGADMVNAGGTVFIMNGRYIRTYYGSVLEFKKSGTPDAYITFKPYPGHNPVISAYGGSWNAVVIDGSYVILDGLELEGNNANLTLAGAEQSYLQSRATPAVFNASYNTNAISIGKDAYPHHVIIRNCKVHDFPGGGIGAGRCDYVTIENNTVYNNSWYTMYATSGISVLGPKPIDDVTTHKILIRGNTVYNNYTQVKWRRSNPATDVISDGNGIIIDVNNGGQGTPIYTGRTLVENNISYNNGGGGVHAYLAARVDIINNTAYNNGWKVGYPEIDAQDCIDSKIYNNIMYARAGARCNGNDIGAIYDHNIYYNGQYFRQGANDIVADPKFAKLAKDATADFRLQVSSPAINSGSQVYYSATDINGLVRPQGSRPERGAYEYESGDQAQTITFNSIPDMKLGDPDLEPGATASSGLPVIYRSSNTSVAVIIDGKIQIRGGGTVTITASQGGNAIYAEAPEVSQAFTVTAEGYNNLIGNSTFDINTEGWTTSTKAPATITLSTVPQDGYTGKALNADVSNVGATAPGSYDIQLITAAPLVAGRTYVVKFKASTSVTVPIDVILQANKSPFTTYKAFWAIKLTPKPIEYSYTYTATTTDETTQIKFMLGNGKAPIYIDDVIVAAIPVPEMNVKQDTVDIVDNTGTYDFDTVAYNTPKTVSFVIESIGERTLNLIQAQKVRVTGEGFSLVADAPASINAGGNATFVIGFNPTRTGAFSGSISIANDDPTENPYNFALTATVIKANQIITFNSLPHKTLADADFSPGATASSGLPVTYTSSDTTVASVIGDQVHIVGIGTSTITASQAGNVNYNAAIHVSQMLTVTDSLRTAVNPKVGNGLTYNYYRGVWRELPDFSKLTPVKTGTVSNFTLSPSLPNLAFAMSYTGYIDVPADGVYTFYTKSDDGSKLYVANELVVNNDGLHAATEKSGAIPLKKGKHAIAVYYFNLLLGSTLTVSYSSPAIPKTTIPSSSLYYGLAPLTLEAEDATLNSTQVLNNKPGFTGTGFVNYPNLFSGYIEWAASVPEAGEYELQFRYASTAFTRVLKLTVNGSAASSLIFPATDSWSVWQTVSVVVNLKAGLNKIRTSAMLANGLTIDNVSIENRKIITSPPSVSAPQPMHGVSFAYPNPAISSFRVDVPAAQGEQVRILLYDQSGNLKHEQKYQALEDGNNSIEVDVQSQQQGTYLVKVITKMEVKSGTVIIYK